MIGPLPRVVVTGSECTGKTTLAARLAEQFGMLWVPEYARQYADAKCCPLDAVDVEPIARGQIAAQDGAARTERRFVFDTDLLSTVVYGRHYYGSCPAWIEAAAHERVADLYLLCHPDVPWVADGAQRDRGDRRPQMHELFVAALAEFGARWVDVRGPWADRDRVARDAIEELVG